MKDLPSIPSPDSEPAWRPLHQAIYDGELEKVSILLSEGANWRETLLKKGEIDNGPRGKQLYTNSMNALEVAVVCHQVKTVAIILTEHFQSKDSLLVQKACRLAFQFNTMEIVKEIYKYHPVFVNNEFIRALKDNNLNLLFKLSKDILLVNFDTIKDEQGNHILHVIAKKGTKDNLDEVLKLKPSVSRLVNLPNAQGNTPLHIAAEAYNRDVIIALTDNGALIGKPNLQGDTALHLAAEHTNSGAVERLCRAGYLQNRGSQVHQVTFDILAKNKQKQTAKMRAKSAHIIQTLNEQETYRSLQNGITHIYQGNQTALKEFMTENPSALEKADEQGNTLLHHAIIAYKQTGNSCILEILNAKPNVNIKNNDGLTPLLLAASLGVWSVQTGTNTKYMVLCLRDSGANMSETDSAGFTALHYAAIQDASWSISLLTMGSNVYVDTVTSSGLAAIHLAALYGKKQAFDALKANKADINMVAYPHALPALLEKPIQTTQEITPLFLALNSNAKEIVNTIFHDLVDNRKTAILQNIRSLDGSTILHHFANAKDFHRFKKALLIGVDPFVTNDANYLPFHYACAVGALDIVKHYIEVLAPSQSYWSQLKTRTFNINDLPEKGINALALAEGNNAVIQYLKSKGAVKAYGNAERSKSTFSKVLDFYDSQTIFNSQLKSTKMNQALTMGRMIGSTLLSFPKGIVGMGVAAAHQALLYGMPTIMQQSSALYYFVKPSVHNRAPKFVERGLDAAATVTSTVAQGAFLAIDCLDIATNPARRIAGAATSMGMANVASRFTDNREIQGAAFFFGREIGMFAIEAYQNYDRLNADESRITELKKAYDLWTSVLGEENGQRFVTIMDQFSKMHQSLLESVGWFEHTVLSYAGVGLDTIRNSIRSIGLETLDENLSVALSITSASPLALYSSIQACSRDILQIREQVLTNIEHFIAENLLPDSLHRDVTLQFLQLNQTVLLAQKLMAKKEEILTQENKVKVLEEERDVLDASAIHEKANLEAQIDIAKNQLSAINQEYDVLAEKVTESQSAYDTLWKKTPKGALEFKCQEARQNHFNQLINIESLNLQIQYLKELKVDDVVIAEVNNKLQEAEKSLIDLQATLEATEADWLKLANPVEIQQLPKHKAELGKKIEAQLTAFKQEQSIVFTLQSTVVLSLAQLNEAWVSLKTAEQKVENAKIVFDIIDLHIKAIDNPVLFNSRATVDNAFDQYPTDCEQVVKIIIDKVVATGMISLSDANARMRSSLVAAFDSHKHKADQLNKVLTHHYLLLSQDYRASLIQQRILLQKASELAISEYNVANEYYDAQKMIVLKDQLAYETLTGVKSADTKTFEQILHQPNNWDSTHHGDDIRSTLTLLGQSNMSVNAMIDSGGPASQWHKAACLAKSLVNYKYLFISAPGIDVRLQEIDTLAAELVNQTLDPSDIAILKQKLDLQIATLLVENTSSIAPHLRASNISNQLQNGFRYHDDQSFAFESESASLSETLTAGFEAKDVSSATQAIAKVLQEQTAAISIAEVGVYTSPVVAQHVPSRSHGLKRWWDKSKELVVHYGKKALQTTGGVSAGVDSGGVSAGFTYGNQFRVIEFSRPTPETVFTIPQRTRTPIDLNKKILVADSEKEADTSFVPFTERVIKDIPHVVPMPWESSTQLPAQPLMFSAQAQAAAQSAMAVSMPLQPANDTPHGKITPSSSTTTFTSLRTKPAPIDFDEIFVSPLALHKDLTLIPELEGELLIREPNEEMPSELPQTQKSAGEKLLNLVVGDAEAAVPLVIGAAMAAGALSAMGVVLMQPHQDEEQQNSGNDDHFKLRSLFPYFGSDPSSVQGHVDPVVFPAVSSSSSKTETLVDQPGAPSLLLTTPYFALKTFENVYHMVSANDKGGIYDHDYQKHQRAPGGGAMWGNDVSINPIPNAEIGQKLLDTAYTTPNKPNQKFNYYEGKIIKFRSSNDGRWHSYEIDKDVINQVGDSVLKQFLKNDLISKTEFKSLLKK